jgi:DNA-directed RNA polymerase specialized sigma24 family protein
MGLKVPESYEEFLDDRQPYRSWCFHLLLTRGVPIDDAEAALQDLLLDFWEKQYLEVYDPARGTFDTFLFAFVERRSRHHKDALYRRLRWELSTEQPMAENEYGVLTLGDTIEAPPNELVEEDDYFSFETSMAVRTVYQRLRERPVMRGKDYAKLFRTMLGHLVAYDRIDYGLVSRVMGLSSPTIWRMRNQMVVFPEMVEFRQSLY